MDGGEEAPAATAELLARLIRETAGRAWIGQSDPTFTTELTPFPVPGLAKPHSMAALEAPDKEPEQRGRRFYPAQMGRSTTHEELGKEVEAG